MFANCQKGGTNMAGPDVCKTPVGSAVVPIPYPNTAAGATANPSTAATKVLISGMPGHNLRTTIPISNGDNPGVVGGVVSGRVMGPCKHTMGVDSVLIGGSPATKMTNMTGQNGSNSNIKGATIAPAQTTVMLMKGPSAPSSSSAQAPTLGGRHRDTKVDGKKNGTQSHHPIADDVSDIATDDALAIRMDTNDHVYRTGNWGSRKSSKRFRAKQKALVAQGKYDEALKMGIDDIKAQNPGKYDKHIDQMLASAPKKKDGSIDWSQFKRKK